jgi:Glucose-6-phosphate isomerase
MSCKQSVTFAPVKKDDLEQSAPATTEAQEWPLSRLRKKAYVNALEIRPMPSKVGGRFSLWKKVGEEGCGQVYSAVDELTG